LGKGGVFGVSTLNHHKECCVWLYGYLGFSNKMMEAINVAKATQHEDIPTLTNFTREAM